MIDLKFLGFLEFFLTTLFFTEASNKTSRSLKLLGLFESIQASSVMSDAKIEITHFLSSFVDKFS